ncbi:hypothetical protein PIB30_063019 [Stylosanthes scabra]|uniref:Aminotransferase-like plant mobile domain-containing protein n=1 Tax=Stylosanthes scabra TaxID=79078 RepID=A0ABU6YJH6_9FABA|nr:hypothetical protein [Stylosanthes scabra]
MGRGHYHVTGCSLPPWSPHRWGPCWRLCERFPAVVWAIDMGDGRGFVGARPPLRGGGKNEYAAIKTTWLRDRVRHTPTDGPSDVLRQYARCYILLMIGCWLFSDKSDNMVSVRWVPLLENFESCKKLSWGLARFRQWCLPQRNVVMLNGLRQDNRDKHDRRMIAARANLDRVGLAQFVCTPYDDPAWDALRPAWFTI